MKIIDAHMHFSKIKSFENYAKYASFVDYSAEGYLKESAACGIVKSICMGLAETIPGEFPDHRAATPMLAGLEENTPEGMFICAGINPHMLDDDYLAALESAARDGRIVGFKLYAGYYHCDVNDPVYTPVYRLAEEYGLPVAIHSGDTFSDKALLEYALPLRIDRLAVTWRNVNFVICHMGAPWAIDGCEVAYKNRNVYLDISGLFIGSAEEISSAENSVHLRSNLQAIEFLNDYHKLLFGTDWPLAPMAAYVDFCQKLVPADKQEAVFYGNAARIFRLE